MAARFSKITSVLVTPSTFLSGCFTVIGQAAQVMPGTASVTVCGPAHTGAAMRAVNANEASSLLMTSSGSVEKRKNIGKCKRDQHKGGHDPEDDLVGRTHLGDCTGLTRCARLRWTEDASPGKKQRHKGRTDEDRAIRLQNRQVADPRTAKAKRYQHQRAQAAGRGQDGGEAAGHQG